MEGGGFPFGGDPEDLLRGIQEFAAQQAESVQEAQREQFATLTLNTAVELTAAALSQLQPMGSIDEQAIALRLLHRFGLLGRELLDPAKQILRVAAEREAHAAFHGEEAS